VSEPPRDDPGGPGPSPIESLFQELVRRGASLGLSSFFLTEEAVRRAFSDRVPSEWLESWRRQGDEVRADIVDRAGKEFGNWLRSLDLPELLDEVLARYEISANIELEVRRREDREGEEAAPGARLSIVTRRK
jgi:hypothetical protein